MRTALDTIRHYIEGAYADGLSNPCQCELRAAFEDLETMIQGEEPQQWLAGYAMTVYTVDGATVVYYAPTLADGEQQIIGDQMAGAFGKDGFTKVVSEWSDELIPMSNPSAGRWVCRES